MPERFFFRGTQTEPTTGGAIYDLSTTIGSDGAISTVENTDTTFVTTSRWRVSLGGVDIFPSVPTSLNITGMVGNNLFRWRINRLDSSGNIQASSDWSAEFNTTGIHTATLTAPNAEPYAMLEVEFQTARDGGMPSGNSVSVGVSDTDSYIDVDIDDAEHLSGSASEAVEVALDASIAAIRTVELSEAVDIGSSVAGVAFSEEYSSSVSEAIAVIEDALGTAGRDGQVSEAAATDTSAAGGTGRSGDSGAQGVEASPSATSETQRSGSAWVEVGVGVSASGGIFRTPGDLHASRVDENTVSVTWESVTSDFYRLERQRFVGGTWSESTVFETVTNSYTDEEAADTDQWRYRVRAGRNL